MIATIRKLFIGAFIALVTAVVIRILVPIPIATMFAVLLFFYMLQIIEEYFGRGARIAASWITVALRTVVAFAAFIALRFLIGQVLGLYPVDTLNYWQGSGGFTGVFWGRYAPANITYDLIILGFLGWVMWGCLRGERMAKVAAVILVSFLVFGVLFPMWASTLPAKKQGLDKSFAERGIPRTIAEKFPAISITSIGHAGSSAFPDFAANVLCNDAYAEPINFNDFPEVEAKGVFILEIVKKGCWSRALTLPESFRPGWCYQPSPAEKAKDPDWWIAFDFLKADGSTFAIKGPYRWGEYKYHPYLPMTIRLQGNAPKILVRRGRPDMNGFCTP